MPSQTPVIATEQGQTRWYTLPAPWYQLAVMPFAIGVAGAACFWAIGDRLPPDTKTLCCAAGTFGTVLIARGAHLFWTTGKEAQGKAEKAKEQKATAAARSKQRARRDA